MRFRNLRQINGGIHKDHGFLTHQKVSDYHNRHKKADTQGLPSYRPYGLHAVPETFNPLSTEGPDDEHEGVEQIGHVPAGKLAVV